jgi:hypothetical protein
MRPFPIVTALATRRTIVLSARVIVLIYVIVAILWIGFSNCVAGLLFPDPGALTVVETLKGVAFVAVTAGQQL